MKFDPSKMKPITPEEWEQFLAEHGKGEATIQGPFEEITVENAHLVYPHLRAHLN